ncbi:MAG: hypothetical protein M1833_006348 [Piccolia ochrophora]|nr:MAG: hypothetical protein M1833_006348 [Piccolia ochrophora]
MAQSTKIEKTKAPLTQAAEGASHSSLPASSPTTSLGHSSELVAAPTERGDGNRHVEYPASVTLPFRELRFLGRGTYADVHEVDWEGIRVARKKVFCRHPTSPQVFMREVRIMRRLRHKHVVEFLGSYTQPEFHGSWIGLLMRPVALCDLGFFLKQLDSGSGSDITLWQQFGFSETLVDDKGRPLEAFDRLRKAFGCVANAVEYLHDERIRHKDFTTGNILMGENGVCISDFGLSYDFADKNNSISDGNARGTYKYCAPELARYEPRGRAADIHSVGCVFLEIATVLHGIPLEDLNALRVVDDSYQSNAPLIKRWVLLRLGKVSTTRQSDCLCELISDMLNHDPTKRPTATMLARRLYMAESELGDFHSSCCELPPWITWPKTRREQLDAEQANIELQQQQIGEERANLRLEAQKLSLTKTERDVLLTKARDHNRMRLEVEALKSDKQRLEQQNAKLLEDRAHLNLLQIQNGRLQADLSKAAGEMERLRKPQKPPHYFRIRVLEAH